MARFDELLIYFVCFILVSCDAKVVSGNGPDGGGRVFLTVAYCPTVFSGEGAVVEAIPDGKGGNGLKFEIIGRFKWPSEIFGCPVDYDPTVTFDPSTNLLYLYFIDGPLLVVLDIKSSTIKARVTPQDIFFSGYENMAWLDTRQLLVGVSATVTENGYCSDGCFQYGSFDLKGQYTNGSNIPYKAVMDDSHIITKQDDGSSFWIQASYPLDSDAGCGAPHAYDLCLLALDSKDGTVQSKTFSNFTIYKYGPPLTEKGEGVFLAWIEGFTGLCQHPYNDFLFAEIDLNSATATPIACIPQSVTVHMDEWISSFSFDGKMFATSSGDTEAEGQFLLFDTSNGSLLFNSNLTDLATHLKSYDNFFLVWSVDWAKN